MRKIVKKMFLAASFCGIMVVSTQAALTDNGLTLIKPTGGETFYVGDSMTVVFKLDSGVSLTGPIIFLSPDKGKSKGYLGMFSGAIPTNGVCSVKVYLDSIGSNPLISATKRFSLVSDSCYVYVQDYNGKATVQTDTYVKLKIKPSSISNISRVVKIEAPLCVSKDFNKGTYHISSFHGYPVQYGLFSINGQMLYTGTLEAFSSQQIPVETHLPVFLKTQKIIK